MRSRTTTTIPKKYLVLTSNMLPDGKADELEAVAKTLPTSDAAARFAQREGAGWTYTVLDERTGILQYKGIDVAMFYQRQTTYCNQAEEGPVDHAPAKTLKSMDEAWMRISLLETKSALKQAQFFTREFDQAQAEARQVKALAESRKMENEILQNKILQLEKDLEKQKVKV